jgi:haloalkane dehalogenase
MRGKLLLSLALVVPMVASCGEADGGAASTSTPDPTGTVAASSTTESVAEDDGPAGGLADQFDGRYCEVLTVTIADSGTTAEVWGTQGLNDCPQEAFAGIDPAAVAADLGVSIALPNGPRYWVLDDIVANELAGSGERRAFNGIEMRSVALVDLGEGLPDRRPYAEVSVARDTEFRFGEGREIHELSAPDGSVYVMQSYSVEVDPALTADSLAGLGDRLALPEGWAFTSRVLDEDLVVEDVEGIATVIQDELTNSYQLRTRG